MGNMIYFFVVDSGNKFQFPMDVMHSRPFVHSAQFHWKAKMALSNSYSQLMNNCVNRIVMVYNFIENIHII